MGIHLLFSVSGAQSLVPGVIGRLSQDLRPAAHTQNLDIEGRARLGELGIHVGEGQAYLHSVTVFTGRRHIYDLLIAVNRLST